MTKLARLIAQEEGFGIPGAVPTRDNNPGDLIHSPHSSHAGESQGSVGIIDSLADGWEDLERQLQLYAERGLTLKDMIYDYAPPPANDPAEYLDFICGALGCSASTLVSDALKIP